MSDNRRVEPAMVPVIKGMLERGDIQQDIAAFFGLNGGRIAEINTGQRYADVPAMRENLPPPGPYHSPYAMWRSRIALEEVAREVHAAMDELRGSITKAGVRVDNALRIAQTELRRAELG